MHLMRLKREQHQVQLRTLSKDRLINLSRQHTTIENTIARH